jgi:glycosyltransferase involved in cell wall biosynthesis
MILTFRISVLGSGGAERVFISVATALVRQHDIEIHFVVDKLGQGSLEQVVIDAGFKLFGLDCGRTAESILPFKKYLESQRPDVVISAYTDTNMAMLLSAKMASHKSFLIVSEHASLDEHWKHLSWKRKKLLNMYVGFGYRLADHVLTVSDGIATQVNRRLKAPAKVSRIHNPVRFSSVDVEGGKVASDPAFGGKTILAVGRVTKQKAYPNLLQAFNLVAKGHDVRLVIVGETQDQSERAWLEDFIAKNDLGSRVQFVGFTENVSAYYRSADLFVLSSAWEGFGNVLVEALAFGLPIVSTDCNHGPAEILCDERYGSLVPVGDSAALAAAIGKRLDMPAGDKDVLYRRADEFSEAKIGEQYWKLFQQLGLAA